MIMTTIKEEKLNVEKVKESSPKATKGKNSDTSTEVLKEKQQETLKNESSDSYKKASVEKKDTATNESSKGKGKESAKVQKPEKEKKDTINKEVEVVEKQKSDNHSVESDFPDIDLENFDWSQIDSSVDDYSSEEREKLEKQYVDTISSISEQELVTGKIVAITKREVVVNIGYKSEAIITISEFRYNPDLKVDDEIDVYVEIQEDKNGQLILSHQKARALKAWEHVNKALGTDEVIQGFVKCRTKGGLIVDVLGLEAFLPGSQIDVKPVRDYDMYVGKTMDFRVVKINNEFKNVVVSHKALIESELKEQRKEIISKLEKGQVLEGLVKNITSYGVFMDLGGVDGLIHITDLSWGRISHPEEIVNLDQKLNVVILDFDENKTRIQLGLKQLSDHPWDSLETKLETGSKIKGKVVVVADYGAFLEVAPGIEGLVHVSEMSWSQHLRSAQDFLKVGDEVEAQILTLDKEDRKMSLGIKQLVPDPWDGVDKNYAVGTKHTGVVRNFTNYGIFVELEEGVDGLIHISDLSWTKKIKHPSEFVELDSKIDVLILELDMDERKVSLGHKQTEENPWEAFETVYTIDSKHQGTVISVNEKGVVIILPHGVEAFTPSRHAVKEDGSKLAIDDTLDFKVLEFSKDTKRILVSHSATYSDPVTDKKKAKFEKVNKGKSLKKAVKSVRQNLEKTTLGDIDVLSSLKLDLEKGEKAKAAEKDNGDDHQDKKSK